MSEDVLLERIRKLEGTVEVEVSAVHKLTTKIALLELQNERQELDIRSFKSGINRGLWVIGGGFISATVAWVISGGLLDVR